MSNSFRPKSTFLHFGDVTADGEFNGVREPRVTLLRRSALGCIMYGLQPKICELVRFVSKPTGSSAVILD